MQVMEILLKMKKDFGFIIMKQIYVNDLKTGDNKYEMYHLLIKI
jgi:hypothetical protein